MNLLRNGKIPRALSDLSLALRCSISELVSSIKRRRRLKHKNGRETKQQMPRERDDEKWDYETMRLWDDGTTRFANPAR